MKKMIKIGIIFVIIIVLSLNIITVFRNGNLTSNPEAKGYSRYSMRPGYWKELPGRARDIGIGVYGEKYIVGTQPNHKYGNYVYKWVENDRNWVKIHGLLWRISVDCYGNPWGINREGDIYQGNGDGGWTRVTKKGLPDGSLLDIAIGGHQKNEQIYVIGPNQGQGGYAYKFDKFTQEWKLFANSKILFTRIAVHTFNYAWAINGYNHKIYEGNKNSWREVPGKAYWDITAGHCKNIYMLGEHSVRYGAFVCKYYTDPFERFSRIEPLGIAKNIAVDSVNCERAEPWIINTQGQIYRYCTWS